MSLGILKENSDQQFSANFEAGVVRHGSSYQDFLMPKLGKIMSKKFQLSKDVRAGEIRRIYVVSWFVMRND